MMADLTAPTFETTPNGIRAESKEKVCERLGRSTDRGDAVVMSWFDGPKQTSHAMAWMDMEPTSKGLRHVPQIVTSGRAPLSVQRRR